MAWFDVTIHADSNGTHLHQIYSGLYELEARGIVTLKFTSGEPWAANRGIRQILVLSVKVAEVENRTYRIVYDMVDDGTLFTAGLENCDLYFKRSYSYSVVRELSESVRDKIQPFGFNYQVVSPYQHGVFKRIFLEKRARAINSVRFHNENLLHWIRDSFVPSNKNRELLPITQFEQHPQSSVSEAVLFQCRLWDPDLFRNDSKDDIEQINLSRVEVIRLLRSELGERFVGGLQPNGYTNKYFPELITQLPSRRFDFLSLVHRHLITIATTGISGSIGWKFGEYVAAARCIVSEPLVYSVGDGFKKDINYLEFSNAEQCLEQCEYLLSCPDKASAMREANFHYYNRYLRPDMLILNGLMKLNQVSE